MKLARFDPNTGRVLEILEVDDDSVIASDEIALDPGADVVPGVHRWDGFNFVEMPFKALLLDGADVLVGVVELASASALTAQHVDLRPHGGDCDWKPGLARWDREKQTLIPLKVGQVKRAAAGVSLEQAFAALLESNPQLKQNDVLMVWLAGYRASLDGAKKKKGAA